MFILVNLHYMLEIVRCHTYENFMYLSMLFKRYELSELVWLIEEKGVIINEKVVNLFVCGDWPALVYELGVLKPNPSFMGDETCFKCDLSEEEIRIKCLQSPIQFPKQLNMFLRLYYPLFKLKKRCCCWIYGVSCILFNTCKILFNLSLLVIKLNLNL